MKPDYRHQVTKGQGAGDDIAEGAEGVGFKPQMNPQIPSIKTIIPLSKIC